MDNYYETCLTSIQMLIEERNEVKALELLDQELSMPYVPEPYFSNFKALRDTLRLDNAPNAKYFDDMDQISDALLGNDNLKHKALISLERMNLRAVIDDLQSILMDKRIDDWLKKQIVFYLMDQSIDATLTIHLKSGIHELDILKLENPIGSKVYLNCLDDLVSTLESDNPSLLMLCIAELDQQVLEYFPQHFDSIASNDVLKRVKGYLDRG
ncbi:DUF3196 family protein [Erysipelothrix sp. HDW6C]|nr:DUF3196 family protein [Erysipelothrix sp. HDW6C]QIK69891.1 DUF3196 family protein [Erysipelothrix sp. HDW6C]